MEANFEEIDELGEAIEEEETERRIAKENRQTLLSIKG